MLQMFTLEFQASGEVHAHFNNTPKRPSPHFMVIVCDSDRLSYSIYSAIETVYEVT